MEYIKLIINDIPFYPANYQDSKYIPGRKINDGLQYSFITHTEKFLATVNDPYIKKQRPIQSKVFEQHIIIAYAKENIPVEILENSDNIQVQFKENDELVTWQISVIAPVGKEKQNDTYDYKYTINFIKLVPDSFTLNNFLSYDTLQNKSYVSDLVNLQFRNGKNKYTEYATSTLGVIRISTTDANGTLEEGDTVTVNDALNSNENFPVSGTVTEKNDAFIDITHSYTSTVTGEFEISWEKTDALSIDFYTAIIPEFSTLNREAEKVENEGGEYVSDYYNFDMVAAYFVLSTEEKNNFVKYVDYCDAVNIVYGSNTYRKQPGYRLTYEMKNEGLQDLYFITMNLIYNKKHLNIYE